MPRWIDVLVLRLRSLFRRDAVDRDFERELRFHLEQHVAELVADGVSPQEARERALREFGSVTSVTQQCRDTRRVSFVSHLIQDVRYGTRTLLHQPMLLIAATTSIALGVGANLAIFGLANDLLLSTPSAARPDRLIHIRTRNGSHTSYDAWRAYHESGAIAGVAGYRFETDINWTGAGESVTLLPLMVTANFFDVIQVPIALGRGFTEDEARLERDPRLAIVSHGFWVRRLGGDTQVIGSSILLNGQPYTVIGVLPSDVRSLPGYGLRPDVWLPLSRALVPQIAARNTSVVQLVGRLRDTQSIEQATAALVTAGNRLRDDSDERDQRVRSVFAAGAIQQAKDFKEILLFSGVLLMVTLLILFIACANVAGLLLARGAARQREIALRQSLGATRGRLVQQLLTEGFLLSVAGVAAGLAVAVIVGRVASQVSLPMPLPVHFDVSLSGRLFWLAGALVVASTFFCSLSPALQSTRPALLPAIKQERHVYIHRRVSMRGLLVIGQVAISMLLLATTMLFLRNLAMANTLAPGFDVDRTLVAQVTFVEGRQGTEAAPAIALMTERLRSIAGVEMAAFAGGVPLTLHSGGSTGTEMKIEGRPAPIRVDYANNVVGPRFFDTMGIDVVSGRDFHETERQGAPRVVIINEEFVRRYFEGESPLGRHLYLRASRPGEGTPAEVIGVVANSKYQTIGEERSAAIYEPLLQHPGVTNRSMHIVVRTAGPPTAMVDAIRHNLLSYDRSAAISVESMSDALKIAFLPSRIGAVIIGALGLLGTALAMVGLYGIVAFSVGRRTAEIGVRMALGATPRSVLRLMLRDGAALVVVGTSVGLLLALAAARPLSTFLVAELNTTDPLSFVGTAAVLTMIGGVATWVPARRALHVQPVVALRSE